MNQKESRLLSMVSIAAKAGKVVSGGFLTEKAIQEGTAQLVLIAENASNNTQKKFMDKCQYYHIPYYIIFDSQILGNQIGKQERTVLAVTDHGLAKQICDRIDSLRMEV